MSRRAVVITGVALVAALALALAIRLGRPEPTPEERIRTLFVEAARAAEEKRTGDVVEVVSERFRGHGLDRRGVKQLVALEVLRGSWVAVAIAGISVQVDGRTARAHVDAVLSRAAGEGIALADLLPGQATAHRFACALEEEDDGWRVVEAEWRRISLAEALAGPPAP